MRAQLLGVETEVPSSNIGDWEVKSGFSFPFGVPVFKFKSINTLHLLIRPFSFQTISPFIH